LEGSGHTLRQIESLLVRGGTIALTHQPRTGAKTDDDALSTAEALRAAMEQAELVELRIEQLTGLSPTPVCVIGRADQG
jgi:hypothetical protein